MNESRLSGFDFPGSADVITMDVMNRFSHESFRFVTKRVKFATQLDDYEDVLESDMVDRLDAPLRSHFLRITSEGYEFMAPLESTQSTGTPGSSAANEGLAGQVDRKLLRDRNLIVIGTDTRSIVPDTTAFPFRAIGSADYNYTKGTSICTVTMISRTSALTAGHCVWRTSTNEPLPMMKVAPGRYVDASTGSMIDPYGTWDVDYTTTFQNYKEKDEQFDMAVVTFKPSNRPDLGCSNVYVSISLCFRNSMKCCRLNLALSSSQKPGDVVGFVGIDRVLGTSSAVNDPRLASLTVTGYPNDYFGKMVTSNACSREGKWEASDKMRDNVEIYDAHPFILYDSIVRRFTLYLAFLRYGCGDERK
jgi:V8-like Glu-specific endopeptidase